MSKVKKVMWDDRGARWISGKNLSNAFIDIDGTVSKDMKIFAKYKGKNIYMTISNEIAPAVFEAVIYDIESNLHFYEDLNLDDCVEISRISICGIQQIG